MSGAMSFDQAPPIGVPLRFLLVAPLFGCAAGILIALHSEQVLASRWSGAALAATHLLTLGFMLQAMCGALMQVLPVAVGANVWRPKLVALLTQGGLLPGTLLLAGGFLFEAPAWIRWAVPLLGLSLVCFASVVAAGLLRTGARSPTVRLLRFAVLALLVTIALGVMLATVFGWNAALPAAYLTELHLSWGLLGWGLLLLVAVAILVVPMFQLTPPYRKPFTRYFPGLLVAVLAGWSVAGALGESATVLRMTLAGALGVVVAGFAFETLRMQQRRRRRHVDAMFLFWRTGMIALLAAVALAFARMASADAELAARLELAIGVALLPGFFVSVINGMLYKIVPFLVWLHLQQRVRQPPNMNQVIAEPSMRWQLRLHWLALAALGAGLFSAPVLAAGGALFALSCAWLASNLLRAGWLYARVSRGAAASA